MKMKMTNTPAHLALAALLAGCTVVEVGPDYKAPDVAVPDFALPDAGLPTTNRTEIGEYRPAEGAEDVRAAFTPADMEHWWTALEDPVLSSLVEGAVTNNVSYEMAAERLEASYWEMAGTVSSFLPHLTGSGGFTRSENGRYNASRVAAGTGRHQDFYTAGLGASLDIDLFGGNTRAVRSAAARFDASQYDLDDAWAELTASVARQYIELRTTQQRIEVARTNLVLQTETYDILKSRFDSGIGDELAVSQSKYVVDQTHATIPPLLAREESLKNALAILVGAMPGDLHGRLAECPRRDWLIAPRRLAEAPLDMIRRRPDVRAAERSLAAQTERIGVARSLWFPKLSISGSLGLESVKGKHLLERGALYGSFGPSISWPIFQGGGIYAAVKAEEAKTREACLAYELAVENACREVRDAYAAYTQELHRYEALKGAVKAAQDAVTISNDLYKNGLRDFTAVIDAQRSLLSLAEASVISRGQITQNLITLCRALGGGAGEDADDPGDGDGEADE